MKKNIYYSALLLTVLLISSCGKANSDPVSVSPSIPSSVSPTAAPTVSPTTASPTVSPSNSPSYMGEWTVSSVVGATPISAPVDESFIGMKATYTKEKASFGKIEILNPEYTEQDLTNDEFFNEYRNHLSDIGIKSESVKTVSINNWTNAGSFLIIKDDQTMIFLWDGNYYEMKRQS
ncbi:hypothetical protein EHS13_25875 [Paenibacillus psychroresistens]|uniref:Lipocalin-like domain-containing protein n=1 Tax=Paenibacillus psychroresistens TaxID=1778678 RepID=A0A6B8RPY4_9BACL|nr:hypothetical protein [Paenibacillus psychroresistens]QGQ98069.1 hypothetical protein EHS13_25875 [Paenibacillus psychroresistens]